MPKPIPEELRREVAEKVILGGLTERAAIEYLVKRGAPQVSRSTIRQIVSKYRGEVVLGAQLAIKRNAISKESIASFENELARLECAVKCFEEYIAFWMDMARQFSASTDPANRHVAMLARKEARENWMALVKAVDIIADIKKERQTLIKTIQVTSGGSVGEAYKKGYEDGKEDVRKLFEQKCMACRNLNSVEGVNGEKQSGGERAAAGGSGPVNDKKRPEGTLPPDGSSPVA